MCVFLILTVATNFMVLRELLTRSGTYPLERNLLPNFRLKHRPETPIDLICFATMAIFYIAFLLGTFSGEGNIGISQLIFFTIILVSPVAYALYRRYMLEMRTNNPQ